ncbi:MAG TPA: helix-turn-helix domain-containing protein [bacterium]|nr:helix-turn-helix domain-containing protein [bacterium]
MPKPVFMQIPQIAQDKILLAAAETFAEKGLRLVTMADVAQQAQISPDTLSMYFDGKQDLIASVLGRAAQYFNQVYIEVGNMQRPFWERVEYLLRVVARRVRTLGAYLNVYNHLDAFGAPELAKATYDRFESRAGLFYQNLVLTGVQEAALRDDLDVTMMALAFQEAVRIVLSRRANAIYRARSKTYLPEIPFDDDGDEKLVRRLLQFLKSSFGV